MKGYYKHDGKRPKHIPDDFRVDTVLVNGILNKDWIVDSVEWGLNNEGYDVAYWRPAGQPVEDATTDIVNHPPHYKSHPSGVECIQITEHMNFCRGNAMKYLWRAGEKGNEIEDLKKARWYLDREIARLEKPE
jgi:hypothetical protein